MLTGVLADSHDNVPLIRRAMEFFLERGVDYMIHAGDFIAPFALKALLAPQIPLVGVFGNNDGEKAGLRGLCSTIFEPPHRFALAGRTIVLTHDLEALARGATEGADVVICGHTHSPEADEGPPLQLNPGEVGGWLSGASTIALLDLDGLEAQIINLQA